jgi:2-polyprenyl-3-methyl-5-hydroxy-6-metoxy-1,4-benzoquinol methylase
VNSVFSIFVDNDPKFQHQALIFADSLHLVARIPYHRLYAHIPDIGSPAVPYLSARGVNIVHVERFGDHKYCNKIAQVDSATRFAADGADYVFLCDCDLAFVSPVEGEFQNADIVLGKTVDFPNPPLEMLIPALAAAGFDSIPPLTRDTLTGKPTLAGNFNGGLYGLPVKWLAEFGVEWKRVALHLLSCQQLQISLGRFVIHIDQLAFCLALHRKQMAFRSLPITYNCPTHIKLPRGGRELTEPPIILHYHDNLNEDGSLGSCGVCLIDTQVSVLNRVIKPVLSYGLFADCISERAGRARTVITRNTQILRGVLMAFGARRATSILDYRCGTASHLDDRIPSGYLGIDWRRSELAVAKGRHPHRTFRFGSVKALELDELTYDLVVCTDILGAVSEEEPVERIIAALATRTAKRLLVCGPNLPWHNRNGGFQRMFSVSYLLEQTGQFQHIYKAGTVGGIDIVIAERSFVPSIGQQGTLNDMEDELLARAIATSEERQRLVECCAISRSIFGWYTKHPSRIFEYPWLLARLDFDIAGRRIGDLGSGLAALPVALANRGADVHTVDSHRRQVTYEAADNANEWGYFDYSQVHPGVRSSNSELMLDTFKPNSFDAWYSVSVVEHMSAATRRRTLDIIARTLKPGGRLLLTLDLEKRSRDLWILNGGKVVEERSQHGTVDDIVKELRARGFAIGVDRVIPLPFSIPVDVGLLEATYYGKSDGHLLNAPQMVEKEQAQPRSITFASGEPTATSGGLFAILKRALPLHVKQYIKSTLGIWSRDSIERLFGKAELRKDQSKLPKAVADRRRISGTKLQPSEKSKIGQRQNHESQ